MDRVYACIDLKSFYASVECVERKLDPLTTNLVVADLSRTEKTICLAVSPSLKSFGLSGRARLYEVVSKIKEINKDRSKKNKLTIKSYNDIEIKNHPNVLIDYIVAKPRMSLYLKYSDLIYNIYLSFLSKEDIYVYSIDECFFDLTNYLNLYKCSPEELVSKMIMEVYNKTGITATGGVGTNLYLSKIAMDIMAKHTKPNKDGVRIFYLDEIKYRKLLWNHVPLTDFWRVGKGYAKKLNENNMYTMGDICLCSINDENKLFKLFGVNVEILIDHAWGIEPCTIKDIKSYKPTNTSLSTNQVMHHAYSKTNARIIVREMVYNLTLDMIDKNMETNMITLYIGYDIENISNGYVGTVKKDFYGRSVPKESTGRTTLENHTSANKIIEEATVKLFNKLASDKLLIRRIGISFNNLKKYEENSNKTIQLDLFNSKTSNSNDEKEERNIEKTVINIKKKFGKNSLLRGIDLLEGATAKERNSQIGGHHE